MKHKLQFFALFILFFAGSLLAISNGNGGRNGDSDRTFGASTADVIGTHTGVNIKFDDPYVPGHRFHVFAGTFHGTIDGSPAKFYCVDLQHNLNFNKDYTDDGNTSLEVTFILNNYYPHLPSGSNNGVEAAAVQAALWHFVDGMDLSSIDRNDVRNRAIAIKADADANAAGFVPVQTLVINNAVINLPIGTDALFNVEAYKIDNSPAENIEVELSSTSGAAITPNPAFTDNSGSTPQITLPYVAGHNSVTVTATAEVTIPQGTRYVTINNPGNYQKLVLATPTDATLSVEQTFEWFESTDLELVKFVDVDVAEDGDQVVFTVEVSNNGSIAATGVVVEDLLPAGLVFVSSNPSHGSYDENTGEWNIGTITSGATAVLEITADVDAFTQAFDLGPATGFNLFAIKDVTQPSSDTQGKMAVGRDATLSNYSVGDQLPNSNGTEDVLIVGRKLTFTSGAVYNGNVVYGSWQNVPQSVSITDGTIRQDNVIDFSAAKTHLKTLSSTLAGYPANGTVTFEWGGLFLTGNDPFLNVFEVDGNDLSVANNMEIDVPNGAVVLVNINRNTVSWMGGLVVRGTSISNVLYNFHKANNLTISGIDIQGSILAPKANVNFIAGVINGQMIVKSLEGQGQMNNTMFIGNIPIASELTNTAEIVSADQPDPDSTPGNGDEDEDDYDTAVVTIDLGAGSGDDGDDDDNGNWEYVGDFGLNAIVCAMTDDKDGNLLSGTYGGAIYRSEDEGLTWTRINDDMNVGFVWTLAVDGNYIFAGTEAGFYKSNDNGSTWAGPFYPEYDVRALVIDDGNIYGGTWGHGVFVSDDNGSTWTAMSNGLQNTAVHTLASFDGELYAGTFGSGVEKYDFDNNTWNKLPVGYDYVWALGIADNGDIYAGTYGGGVYRSVNDGETWSELNTGLSAQFIYAVSTDGDDVYISSWANGVFKLESNKGEFWAPMGMAGTNVSSMMFASGSDKIYAGTSTGQVFVSVNNVTSAETEEALPVEFDLKQNYPNPFNPTTTIAFSIPEAGMYSMKIYNILGQEVATLLNNDIDAGNYELKFDASQLSSGIYIYTLTGKNVNLTKKMILMK
ncbi:MAG: choice-of-anchor A family protein [Melioribacteraceae bacterium]|nr:choice-of-anchor A family protein [Melioribacteraceae bacterium]MCF8356068.1 choice-of-anchor A family protein [Melioribacteraceae bacterium]MCF8394895.1 choice-of-anchor A family protein [Melioribacteraceae bacterium]MCF8420428.1 choice-of-anchor A family protein [Melioribacteraceae bacterium]